VAPILSDSEEHVDWLETQLHLIQTLGLPKFLLLQSEANA